MVISSEDADEESQSLDQSTDSKDDGEIGTAINGDDENTQRRAADDMKQIQDFMEIDDAIDQQFSEQQRSFIRFRYCHKCKQVKPPRAHHCSVCE